MGRTKISILSLTLTMSRMCGKPPPQQITIFIEETFGTVANMLHSCAIFSSHLWVSACVVFFLFLSKLDAPSYSKSLRSTTGIVQATVAYLTNMLSAYFISVSCLVLLCLILSLNHVPNFIDIRIFTILPSPHRTSTATSTFSCRKMRLEKPFAASYFFSCSLP